MRQSKTVTIRSEVACGATLELAPVVVVVGHYGVGKTNFALNLAFDAARSGYDVALVDSDVVNPYFRSSDYRDDLESCGIRVIAPVLAGTALDTPSLTGEIQVALDVVREAEGADKVLIVDAGGDDAGVTALARFANDIDAGGYDMLYVVNRYRNLTQSADEAAAVLAEIEAKSGLRATGIVNNSHLKEFTDSQTIEEALSFGFDVAERTNRPLFCATVPESLPEPKNDTADAAFRENGGAKLYPVHIYVKTPWE